MRRRANLDGHVFLGLRVRCHGSDTRPFGTVGKGGHLATLPATYADRGVWVGFDTTALSFARLRVENGSRNPQNWSLLLPGFVGRKETSAVIPFLKVEETYPQVSREDKDLLAEISALDPIKALRMMSPVDIRERHLMFDARFGQDQRMRKSKKWSDERVLDHNVEASSYLRIVAQLMRMTGDHYGEKYLTNTTVETYRRLLDAASHNKEQEQLLSQFTKLMFRFLGEKCGCSDEEALLRVKRFSLAIAPAIQIDSADDSTQGWLLRLMTRLGNVASELEDRIEEVPPPVGEALKLALFPFNQFLGMAARELARVERRSKNLISSLTRIDKALADVEDAKLKAALALDGWQPLCDRFEEAFTSDDEDEFFAAVQASVTYTPLMPTTLLEKLENELNAWREYTLTQRKLVDALTDWRTGKIDAELFSRVYSSSF